ncbi:MAG: glycosyltransferase [Alloprevotella sp.]|nr:glycosyltransferase [Alloprevotella sp.]
MNKKNISIPTYVFNLPERKERRKHIVEQFTNKPEFEVRWSETYKHKIGAVGLWQSIRHAVADTVERNEDDIVILCEDDHLFTEHYNRDRFFEQIIHAASLGTHLLSGGISGFQNAIKLQYENLYWVDWFWATQFIVLFRPSFEKILQANFSDTDVADEFLSKILSNKLVIHPFISVQKEFGYSDISDLNNRDNFLRDLFQKSSIELDNYSRIVQKYDIQQ